MRRAGSLEHVLSPGRIGSLEVRNRILMAPMGSNLAEHDGRVGERLIRYYEERARGGVGLIVVGVGAVAHPAGACIPNQVALSDDGFLDGLRALTRRVHAHGAAIAVQLQHSGPVATRDIAAGRPLWVPSLPTPKVPDLFEDLAPEEVQQVTSYVAEPGAKLAFHEMTGDDIAALVEGFASAADRARRAGFDGVEIHGAHGYVIAAFLSPATNRRTDAYGGSVAGRARLLVEVIRAIRLRVGNDFPVWCRLDGREYRIPGGIVEADAQRTAELAEEAGADAIHVSAYAESTCGAAFTEAPLVHARCGFVDLAAGIRTRVTVPVIAVGRIEPEDAERILREGMADFVAMGRKLLADPELPRKLAEGRRGEIRPCIYCYRCVDRIFRNLPVECAVNPAVGREAERTPPPPASPRHVLVVGGGPAGLEAARLAALRGHRVTLWEQGPRLGGRLALAALTHAPNGDLVRYLTAEVRRLPVDVRLGIRTTPDRVRELGPDVVLVAGGAGYERPEIPGLDGRRVVDGAAAADLVSSRPGGGGSGPLGLLLRILRGLGLPGRPGLVRRLSRLWLPIGRRVALLGGGLVGLEVARFLSERGRSVTVLEEGPTPGREMALPRRWRTLEDLRARGVRIVCGVRVERVVEEGVVCATDGRPETVAADSVLLTSGATADPTLASALDDLPIEVHRIGDCAGVGYVEGALESAARIVRRI